MESIIKWQTGIPEEDGTYLVTLQNGGVRCNGYTPFWDEEGEGHWDWIDSTNSKIIAWCKLSEIEPYKE